MRTDPSPHPSSLRPPLPAWVSQILPVYKAWLERPQLQEAPLTAGSKMSLPLNPEQRGQGPV